MLSSVAVLADGGDELLTLQSDSAADLAIVFCGKLLAIIKDTRRVRNRLWEVGGLECVSRMSWNRGVIPLKDLSQPERCDDNKAFEILGR